MSQKQKANSSHGKRRLRHLRFRDFDDKGHLILGIDEAALIVMDKAKMLLAKHDPSVNVFVCAVAGSEASILAVKREYEKDPRYEIEYFPIPTDTQSN